eukprot:scaffold16430_cov71-Phaeocystis_antarctica.AAC.1
MVVRPPARPTAAVAGVAGVASVASAASLGSASVSSSPPHAALPPAAGRSGVATDSLLHCAVTRTHIKPPHAPAAGAAP